jgi:hypothetical protein
MRGSVESDVYAGCYNVIFTYISLDLSVVFTIRAGGRGTITQSRISNMQGQRGNDSHVWSI